MPERPLGTFGQTFQALQAEVRAWGPSQVIMASGLDALQVRAASLPEQLARQRLHPPQALPDLLPKTSTPDRRVPIGHSRWDLDLDTMSIPYTHRWSKLRRHRLKTPC